MVNSVFLYPVDSTFDPAPIEAFLAARPDVVMDPLGSGIFMVCGIPEAVDGYREQRLEDPTQFPYVVLVTVKPEYVNVFQEYGDEDRLRSARAFVRWMLQHAPCRVEDEYREDLTAKVASEGVQVLYPALLT
ncbi:MAG: hypothetical protein R3B48_15310 [Kofleriaceae bacterium]